MSALKKIATATAIALQADKLIILTEQPLLRDSKRHAIRQLSLIEAEKIVGSRRKTGTQKPGNIYSTLLIVASTTLNECT